MTMTPDVDTWHIPPACAGQAIEVAYGGDGTGRLYRRETDRGDGSVAYSTARADECGCGIDGCEHWQPWNLEPEAYTWRRLT